WSTPKYVRVRAHHDDDPESLHFSRVDHVLTSDLDEFLGLTQADIANGLAAAVNRDVTGSFDAAVVDGRVVVDGYAFTATLTGRDGAEIAIDEAYSSHAFTATVTLSGAVAAGASWTLLLDGTPFTYTALATDTITSVAAGLAAAINRA